MSYAQKRSCLRRLEASDVGDQRLDEGTRPAGCATIGLSERRASCSRSVRPKRGCSVSRVARVHLVGCLLRPSPAPHHPTRSPPTSALPLMQHFRSVKATLALNAISQKVTCEMVCRNTRADTHTHRESEWRKLLFHAEACEKG